MNNCYFDGGLNYCCILKEKQCDKCKFRKTEKEYNLGVQHAKDILTEKGLITYQHYVNEVACIGAKREERK